MQIGSQRVSSIVYKKAQELLSAGAIGELNMVTVWYDRNSAQGAWEYTVPYDASPETCDWPRWLGTAPKIPFNGEHFFQWRKWKAYGSGVAGDLFVHLFSAVHLVTKSHGPVRAVATGGLRFWKDGRDVPDVVVALYDYAAGFQPKCADEFRGRRLGKRRFRFHGLRRQHDHRRKQRLHQSCAAGEGAGRSRRSVLSGHSEAHAGNLPSEISGYPPHR